MRAFPTVRGEKRLKCTGRKKGLRCLASETAGGSQAEGKQENRASLHEFKGPKTQKHTFRLWNLRLKGKDQCDFSAHSLVKSDISDHVNEKLSPCLCVRACSAFLFKHL